MCESLRQTEMGFLSLCSPGCLRTHRALLASAPEVLEFNACAITPIWKPVFCSSNKNRLRADVAGEPSKGGAELHRLF